MAEEMGYQRRVCAVALGSMLVALCVAGSAPVVAQGVVIDRTLALVAGRAITLSDVRTAAALGLIDLPVGGNTTEAGAERLIERALILREVERYLPSEPGDDDVDAAVAEIRRRFATTFDFARVLEAGGFTTARLRAWVRDDLRITVYLAQRFAVGGLPTDQEVGAYYAMHREEFERSGVPFDEIVPLVRSRLADERRRELIADWVEGLRRRTEVVELYRRERGGG
jgi:hypothetical protein